MKWDDDIKAFDEVTGSAKLRTPKYLVFLVLIGLVSFYLLMRMGLTGAIALVALPFLSFYLWSVFRKPIIGFYSVIVIGFILLGLARYIVTDFQFGIVVDAVILLTYVALFFNKFYEKINWHPVKKDVTILALIWFLYGMLQFFNPEVQSRGAWFSGVRGVTLYMFLIIPLTLLFIDENKKLDRILIIWGIFSILASLKGLQQIFIGPDALEQEWLNTDAGLTHVLFGKLRAFGFLSDAGQFGANQAYSAVMASIMVLSGISFRKKVFFAIVAVLGFAGMFLSGTRGAISIPLAGFFLFFVLKKNILVMISGVVLLVIVFAFFKFTYVGQGNQFIRRMRTAFNPNDPSLQVRLQNQAILRNYLKTRPFGGGIGHAGAKARAYLPNAYLSNIATDSWYVLIWAELGIVGLVLHLFILFYILIKGSYLIMFRIRDALLKMKLSALAAGMFGVMVASYGNAVLGTMPTSFLIYTSMALLLNSKILDDEALSHSPKEIKT